MHQTFSRSRQTVEHSHDTAVKRNIDSVVWGGLARLRRGELVRFTDIKLDNRLVMRYVHEIYNEYQIPDPLCTECVTNSIIQTPENSRRQTLLMPKTTPHSRKSFAGGWGSRV